MSALPRPEANGLRYTAHARERMAERRLSERIVNHVVAWGDESIQDEEGQVRRYELKMFSADVYYSIFVIVDDLRVVTAYVRIHH
jgi:hypothetical protein